MREHGTIKKWLDDRGFGFIKPDAGGPDIFVHMKAIGNLPVGEFPFENDRIEYDIEQDREGRRKAVCAKIV
jgi:CspA family cold shock protein